MTLLEKYAYERIAREGEQARTQSVHTLSDCTEGRARRRCGVPIKLDLLRVRGGREYRVDRTAANPREPRNIRRPQFLSSRPRKPSAAIFSGEMPIDAHAPDTLHNIGKGDSDTSIHAWSLHASRPVRFPSENDRFSALKFYSCSLCASGRISNSITSFYILTRTFTCKRRKFVIWIFSSLPRNNLIREKLISFRARKTRKLWK